MCEPRRRLTKGLEYLATGLNDDLSTASVRVHDGAAAVNDEGWRPEPIEEDLDSTARPP
jgi:hypothetical protein